MVSNHYVHVGVSVAPQTVRHCAADLQAYKDENVARVNKLLIEDYTRFNITFLSALDQMAAAIVARLKQVSGAAAIDTLSDISTGMRTQ